MDLHIHTVLSPCGDWEMSPKKIIERVKELGLGVIGITDHHTVENYPAVAFWGEKRGVVVIPGMEIQTKEEVHVVALFKDYNKSLMFQKELWKYLPENKNNEDLFGVQVVVNENEEVERIEDRLLLTSVNLSLEEVTKLIREFEGIIVLAHVNKPSFSVLSNLGFIPENLDFDFIELTEVNNIEDFIRSNIILNNSRNRLIVSSDAHYINDIRITRSFINIERLTIESAFFCLKNKYVKIGEMEV